MVGNGAINEKPLASIRAPNAIAIDVARFPTISPRSCGNPRHPVDSQNDPFSEACRGYVFAEFGVISPPRGAVGNGARDEQSLASVRVQNGIAIDIARFPTISPRPRGNRGEFGGAPNDPFS